eukprot:NODE_20_length_44879_cov_0.624654.p5 type:complete len:802 gc:universal NODE_20_length_44879_cov_0.624654:24592-22187(-)
MSSFVPTSLKSLIRQVRNAKTLAEERAIIAKESASIRTFIKEGTGSASGVSGITAQAAQMLGADLRAMNIQKLLYIHMLGYSAHFGQMECVKLVASPRFSDKRLGYLGVMLLLDENQEVLTLVTNCLKNDLNHQNLFISGLALSTLGNIGSEEMLRDLSSEVEKLLGSSSSYIRKKAALCAVRVLKKLPEMSERYAAKCLNLINDKNHGVVITSLSVLIEVCQINPSLHVPEAAQQVQSMLRLMRNLITAGYSPEHDVTGITDPFLQCKILMFFRIIGKDSKEISDQIHDILAQVATKTDASRNVGSAILYETARTILEIKSDQSLRVLGINILGKFLSNKDNNMKYVALQTLSRCVEQDMKAVQRHRTIIVECLKDPDTSIRRRALDLSFTLINATNIRAMMKELVTFLEISDSEFKSYIVTRCFQVTEKFAPNRKWHIETLVEVLRLANQHVKEEHMSLFIKLISNIPDLQGFSTRTLYESLKSNINNTAISQVTAWCLGEYAQKLLEPQLDTLGQPQLLPKDIINQLESILKQQDLNCKPEGRLGGSVEPFYDAITAAGVDETYNKKEVAGQTKLLAFTALFKVCQKFPKLIDDIKNIFTKYERDMNTDCQQRAMEYKKFLEVLNPSQLGEVLAAIPALEYKLPEPTNDQGTPDELSPEVDPNVNQLLDVLGASSPAKTAVTDAKQQQVNDLMSELFGSSPAPVKTPAKTEQPAKEVYNKGGVRVLLQLHSPKERLEEVQFRAKIINDTVFSGVSQVNLLIAVPKTQKLAIQPLSKSDISVNAEAVQEFTVQNPSNVI